MRTAVSALFLRNLLVLVGAYALADWFATVMTVGGAAIGIEYSSSGRLGELWMNVRLSTPRFLAAASGTGVLWLTLGDAATRRWMWGLAGLFGVFGLANRQFHPVPGVVPDPVSRAMDVAVYCLLPTVGCVAAVWLFGRLAQTNADGRPVSDSSGIPSDAHSRALVVAWSILMLLAGAFLGFWIAASAQMQ